jgi:hypothetical protein
MSVRNTIRTARKNMRLWSHQWRIAKAHHDRRGAKFALERSVLWRETAFTLSHQHATN